MPYPTVILYHNVVPNGEAASFYGAKHPTVEQFGAHLDYLQGRFAFVSAAEFLALYEGRSRVRHSKPPCLLTFDDGHRRVWTHAVPLLAARRVPCLVFILGGLFRGGTVPWYIAADHLICSAGARTAEFHGLRADGSAFEGYTALKEAFKAKFVAAQHEEERQALLQELAAAVGRPLPTLGDLPEEMAYVSADEVRAMAQHDLVAIGSHALTHRNLAALPEAEQERELAESLDALAPLAGTREMMISYPDGSHDAATRRLAQRHYRFGFAVEKSAKKSDRYAYPRFGLSRMSVKGLAYWLSLRRRYVYSTIKRLVGRP